MPATILIPSNSGAGAFTSNAIKLEQQDIPAQLIVSAGLAGIETVKLQSSLDNGSNFIDLTDENGAVQFAATGRNIIPINIPLLFRVIKSATVATTISITLTFGKAV